ncbi:hypothetical protein D9V32_03760 [Mycetocola tolaasinivorans]|uniref:Uncharacterized protein n=1 Tax=Mycetocola tolaasinivorans TaxID=76635 RepID=A0A3L7AAB5_9MICO|nr:hypothetical protein D9V32_03760 [Mycetocola tolaasinivorans]
MPITHFIAIPLLILLALYLGFQVARLQRRPRARGNSQPPRHPSAKSLAWTAVFVLAFTLILTERAVLPPLWLQLVVLTIAPLAVGYVAGLIASTRGAQKPR